MRARHAVGIGLCLAASGAPSTVTAATWDFEPEISLSGIYTDNVTLAQRGAEESEYIGAIEPAFSLSRAEGRVRGDIEYRAEAYFFAEDSDRNTTYHSADARTTTDIVTDRLMLDLGGSYGQTLLDPRAPIPLSNAIVTDNIADYWTAEARPYLVQPIGARTEFRASYAHGWVDYSGVELSAGNNIDSFERDLIDVQLGSAPDEPGLQWALQYRAQSADYEDFDEFKYDVAEVRFGIPLTDRFYLIALGGAETDVETNLRSGGLDTDYWQAGFRWQVSARHSLEALVGERFFGDSYSFRWEVDGDRTDLSVTYDENPTTVSLEQLTPQRRLVRGGPTPEYEIVELTSDVYVNKELRAAVDWQGAKTGVRLSAWDARREYVTSADEDREAGVGIELLWNLGPRTALQLSAMAARFEFRDTDVDDDLRQGGLSIIRRLGRQTLLTLAFQYQERETDAVQPTVYDERVASLTVLRRFGDDEVTINAGALPRISR